MDTENEYTIDEEDKPKPAPSSEKKSKKKAKKKSKKSKIKVPKDMVLNDRGEIVSAKEYLLEKAYFTQVTW